MTNTNIFLRLAFICVGFLVLGQIGMKLLTPFIDDEFMKMTVVKWVGVIYFLGLAHHYKIFDAIGWREKGNWKLLWLFWPVWLVALLSVAGGWLATDPGLVINILLFVVAIAITEEVIFRGFFFHYLKDLQPGVVILISSLAFGSMHLMGFLADFSADMVLAQVYFAAGFGMIMGNAKARCGALSIPIFVHAIFDFATIGAAGGIQEFAYDEQIVFGMLFGGTILWAWSFFLLYMGKRRNSFTRVSQQSISLES